MRLSGRGEVMNWYDLLRGLHILAVIAWMAGMLYLPRLYAYHTETAPPGSEFDAHFQVWEAKLLRIIINPAMILTFIFGGFLIWYDGLHRGWEFLLQSWMIVKITGIVFLGWWHGFLARARKGFIAGRRDRPAKFWRMTNELPFIAAILMVLAVTLEFRFG
jgi:protoporphyrinogen IX oxidase